MDAKNYEVIVSHQEVKALSSEAWELVIDQLAKDLSWSVLPSQVEPPVDYEQLWSLINGWVEHYMERDAEQLAQALYRVDVPEGVMPKLEAACPDLMPSALFAHAILRRVIQKVYFRLKYSPKAD